MNQPKLDTHKPFALHHELLQRAILRAATIDAEELDSIGIELAEGYLAMQYEYAEDCGAFLDNFEYLRYLHETRELDKPDRDFEIPKLNRHDVFLALALYESGVAVRLLADWRASDGWSIEDRMREGIKAAISAAKAYQYACWLKEHGCDSCFGGLPAPMRYRRYLC